VEIILRPEFVSQRDGLTTLEEQSIAKLLAKLEETAQDVLLDTMLAEIPCGVHFYFVNVNKQLNLLTRIADDLLIVYRIFDYGVIAEKMEFYWFEGELTV
jgi:hypothetical protein